ncbi:zinc finger protein [Tunisvirus fontaine2]|uniref:Zinc finger protein n=1 Tax=Tunisvirus fontaine2 TaxID=1421067 RepID=V9SGS1_9VIRU|nr:zinc finger protein [Tunisvirus fontaine2]AHC54972.1 zinc finger protein [Tunisvirus fontaine2]
MDNNLCCSVCGITSTTKSNFRKHLLTKKHLANLNGKSIKGANYSCEDCGYHSNDKSHYEEHISSKKHLKRKMGNNECVCCNYTTNDISNFTRHLQSKAHLKKFALANVSNEECIRVLEEKIFEEAVSLLFPYQIIPKEKGDGRRDDNIKIWDSPPLGKSSFPFYEWMKKCAGVASFSICEKGDFCCSIKKGTHEYLMTKQRFFALVLSLSERIHYFCKTKAREEFEWWLSKGYKEISGGYCGRRAKKEGSNVEKSLYYGEYELLEFYDLIIKHKDIAKNSKAKFKKISYGFFVFWQKDSELSAEILLCQENALFGIVKNSELAIERIETQDVAPVGDEIFEDDCDNIELEFRLSDDEYIRYLKCFKVSCSENASDIAKCIFFVKEVEKNVLERFKYARTSEYTSTYIGIITKTEKVLDGLRLSYLGMEACVFTDEIIRTVRKLWK